MRGLAVRPCYHKIFCLLVLASLVLASVEAFSNQLSRPWDGSVTTKKGANRPVSFLRISQVPTKGSSSDGSNQSDDVSRDEADEDDQGDEDEVLSLADTVQVPDTSSSGKAVIVAPSASSQTESKEVVVFNSQADQHKDNSLSESAVAAAEATATVRSCLPDLIKMTRPVNDPAVVMLHMLGVYLALQASNQVNLFWKFLASPTMMNVLLALLLTSSTSMLVNDYYDYKLGNDSLKPNKPLPSHKVPLKVAKRFTSYLYAAALFSVTLVPGVPSRMAVVGGLMLTFWYTQHLKPRTWLKNVVCASLIALSPLASGASALAVISSRSAAAAAHTSGMMLKGYGPILRAFGMMFFAVVGREMTMDINDVDDDKSHGVRTVPVKYGGKFASQIALSCAIVSSVFALGVPVAQAISAVRLDLPTPIGVIRRCTLAGLGCFLNLRRATQVALTEGQDSTLIDKAVDEGLLYVVFLLASFV